MYTNRWGWKQECFLKNMKSKSPNELLELLFPYLNPQSKETKKNVTCYSIYIYIYIYIYMYLSIYLYIYVYMCVCIYRERQREKERD